MNERIKELRKFLGLSGEKFGEKLGVGKTAISRIENNTNNVTEQMFKSICREFNVNENWLRTGEGEMFTDEELDISSFVKKHGATKEELSIVKSYFELDKDIRTMLVEHFKKSLSSPGEEEQEEEFPSSPEAFEKKYPPVSKKGRDAI